MTKYSLIIYLDKELTEKIKLIQKRLFEITNSKACLEIWEPHITIGDGLDIDQNLEKEFFENLTSTIKIFKPFDILIKNYNFMDNWSGSSLVGFSSNVIYLDVKINNQLLKLAKNINNNISNNFSSWYKQSWPYGPHITIAFKDLDKGGFIKAKNILKKETFTDKTIINHIAIAKENEKGKWEEYKRFNFN